MIISLPKLTEVIKLYTWKVIKLWIIESKVNLGAKQSQLLFLCHVALMEPNWVGSWKVFSVYKHCCNFDKLNKYRMFMYTFASVYFIWKSFKIQKKCFYFFPVPQLNTKKKKLTFSRVELYLSAVWRWILESSLV